MSDTYTSTTSITRELLALPEVNFAGISNSLVVRMLPADVQAQIRAASTDELKSAIAAAAADHLPVIQEMHRDLVAAPAARRAADIEFPSFENVDGTFLVGTRGYKQRRNFADALAMPGAAEIEFEPLRVNI